MIANLKNLLIGFSADDKKPSSAVPYGLGLAREAQAHATLQAVSCELPVSHSIFSNFGSGLIREENVNRMLAAEAACNAARQDAAAQGVPCTAQAVQRPFPDAVSTFGVHARVHGLVILDSRPDRLSLERAMTEEVLFNCGRPVVVVPEDRTEFRLDRVMVAWDRSAQATRALNDALPFLAAARTVNVVSIAEDAKGDALPGAEIALHLSRHGVKAEMLALKAGVDGALGTLREQAHAHRTDLIVMGAFVHSWWRQVTLGGVTQAFLAEPPAPLFLAH
ncbi:universal stress protein [Chelatococcus reniformis]|nr:universal stress protein [Chelatococcus reniformis]